MFQRNKKSQIDMSHLLIHPRKKMSQRRDKLGLETHYRKQKGILLLVDHLGKRGYSGSSLAIQL